MDRLADTEVRTAAAKIAGHGGVDVGVGRVGLLSEKRGGGHDLAGLAVATLGDTDFGPGDLDGVGFVLSAEALDGGDAFADGCGNGRDAGADRFAVEVDCAGAALGNAAAVFRAGEGEVFAE